MYMRTWRKRDLRGYQEEFGTLKLIDLLATTGRLYATSTLRKEEDSPEKERKWVVYLSHIMDPESAKFEGVHEAEEYREKLKGMLQKLGDKYGPENVGETFLFRPDGKVNTELTGKVEYDEEGKVKRVYNDGPWRTWRHEFASQTLCTRASLEVMGDLLDLRSWKVELFLPDQVDLYAERHYDYALEKFMRRKGSYIAGIYYAPRVNSSNIFGGKLYRPMGCVVGEDMDTLIEWFRTHPWHYSSPVALYAWGPIDLIYRLEPYLMHYSDGNVQICEYVTPQMQKMLDEMKNEYLIALRFGHATEFETVPGKDAKEEEKKE